MEAAKYLRQAATVLSCILLADGGLIFHILLRTQSRGTFVKWVSELFGHFSAAVQYPLRIVQRLSNHSQAFRSGFMPFQQCPINLEEYFPSTNGKNMALSECCSRSCMFTIPNIKNGRYTETFFYISATPLYTIMLFRIIPLLSRS